jgi:hypothetical protein
MIQTGGFGFQPGSVATGMESRIALSGGQNNALRFVDGASLVPRSNAELWLSGRLAGIKGLTDGIAGAGQALGAGISQSGQNARENRRFLAGVELKKEDQRLREQEMMLGVNNPLDRARERLLDAQSDQVNTETDRMNKPWNPTGLGDVTPEDLPKEDAPDLGNPDSTQTSLIEPASPTSQGWVDQGNGMYSTVIVGLDGKPSKQITAVPDPSSPLGYRVIDETDLTKAEKAEKGNPLLQEQMKVVSNIESARFTLGEIEKKLSQTAARGPATGRARAINPYDVEAQSLENMVNSLVPGLARGVFGEVGVLTDKDVDRYKSMIPNIKTDPNVAKTIVKELISKLDNSLDTNLSVWESSGYDVEGLKSKYLPKKSAASREITTQEEYDALKPGEKFIFNGRTGVKP